MIVQKGKMWILYASDGSRILGTHPSYDAALRQERAIQASKRARGNPVMFRRKLPPWATNAFEPYISNKTMVTHTQVLHQGYVDKLNNRFGNTVFTGLPPSEVLSDPSAYLSPQDRQFYIDMMGGNLCHTLHWEVINPKGTTRSVRELEKALRLSVDEICAGIVELGLSRVGSGWVWGALDDRNEFVLYSTRNHNTPYMRRQTPIFCVDVWEHAYFLDQLADRKAYLENIVAFLDFSKISEILQAQLEGVDPINDWVLG